MPGLSSHQQRCLLVLIVWGAFSGAAAQAQQNDMNVVPAIGLCPHGEPTSSPPACRPCDFPCTAIPAPTGTYVRGWQQAMISSGAQQQTLISRHEWYSGGTHLGPDGLQHLQAISTAPPCGGMIVIEAEPVRVLPGQSYDQVLAANLELNEQRRTEIVSALAARGWTEAEQMVVISNVGRVGIRGIEAPIVYQRGFQSRNRGSQNGNNSNGGLGGGSGGGAGTGGMFGGGGFF